MRLSGHQREDGADPRLTAVENAPDGPEGTQMCRRCAEVLPMRWWTCDEVACPMRSDDAA
jgi:hypothetical protein